MAKSELLVHQPSSSSVLVVGAGGTLGGALTCAFRESGWSISAGWHRRSPSHLASGDFPVRMDVLDSISVNQAIRDHLDHWGRMDALVYASGLSINALLAKHTEDDWIRVMRVNLRGAYYCARAAMESMRQQKRGHIVLVGSFVGQVGGVGQTGYATAKGALHGLAQEMALEMGGDNIQVNVVLPGILESPMTREVSEKARAAWRQANVLGRLSDATEVARFIVFLCGLQQVSGQLFQLDSRLGPVP